MNSESGKTLLPSTSLAAKLRAVSTGIFLESADANAKIVLAAKLPSEMIRYLRLCVPVFLLVGTQEVSEVTAIFSVLAIADDPEAMFYISRTHDAADLDQILAFLAQREIELYAFNEINRNVASFTAQLMGTERTMVGLQRARSRIADLSDAQREIVLNRLETRFVEIPPSVDAMVLPLEHVGAPWFSSYDRPAAPPKYDQARFSREYHVDNRAHGEAYETLLTQILAAVFPPDHLFPSPFGATPGTANRELTDLLAVAGSGICLFEAKAMAVTREALTRSSKRRLANLEKDIYRALRQLRGAYREINRTDELHLVGPHGPVTWQLADLSIQLVIAVSEADPDVARHVVGDAVLTLGEELGVGVHVLDIAGIGNIIRRCTTEDDFIGELERRWHASLRTGAIVFADD